MNKKGNINQLFPAVLALILAGALLSVGIMVLTSFANTTYVTTGAITVVNEAYGPSTAGGHLTAFGQRDVVCTIVAAYNESIAGTLITAGNYTQNPNCNLINTTSTFFGGSGWKINYTYVYSNASTVTTAVNSAETALTSLAVTWLPIIVVVIAAGIVLAILLGAFGQKRK